MQNEKRTLFLGGSILIVGGVGLIGFYLHLLWNEGQRAVWVLVIGPLLLYFGVLLLADAVGSQLPDQVKQVLGFLLLVVLVIGYLLGGGGDW